jgi:hypothetical protein
MGRSTPVSIDLGKAAIHEAFDLVHHNASSQSENCRAEGEDDAKRATSDVNRSGT